MPKLLAKRNRFVSMDNEFLTRKDLSPCRLTGDFPLRDSLISIRKAIVPFLLRYGNWSSSTICDIAIREQRTEKSQTLFTRFAIFQSSNTKRYTTKVMAPHFRASARSDIIRWLCKPPSQIATVVYEKSEIKRTVFYCAPWRKFK